MTAVGQRLAQAPDVDVDRAFLDVNVLAPHVVEQALARMHAFRMGHEEVQQAEFGRAQGQRFPAGGDPVAGRIQLQPVEFDGGLAGVRGAAPQQRLDARDEFAGREGFGEVVVDAAVEAAQFVLFLGAGGEHDDGDIPGQLFLAQAAGVFHAAHARQHPVEQDQVRGLGEEGGLGLVDVIGLDALKPGLAQGQANHLADGGFVFDNQNSGAHTGGTFVTGSAV